MKKLLVGTALVALLAGPSSAADMPIRSRIVAAAPLQVWSWAGFYVGAHGGYGWANNDFITNLPPTAVAIHGIDSKGWLAGGHVGYNWQKGWLVAGLELDISATGIEGTSRTAVADLGGGQTEALTLADKVKWLSSARARLGWAPETAWPIWLYATGGLAWERLDRTGISISILPGVGTFSAGITSPNDRFGWVVGAGAEARLFNSDWLIRLEYLHYEFGSSDSAVVSTSSNNPANNFAGNAPNQKINVVRAGLSYKF